MDNHNNYPFNYFRYGYSKGEDKLKNTNRSDRQEAGGKKSDEDLIIEENTIYEIDRDCIERLKRSRKRLI